MAVQDVHAWFHAPLDAVPEARPRAVLVCFPYAGGGPSAYHAFCRALPLHLRPLVARLPGREASRQIPALTDLDDIAAHLAEALPEAAGGLPMVFWGHSMGALVAFEVARRLGAGAGPRCLVVSGSKAPQLPGMPRPVPVEALDDARFLQLLQGYGGMPSVILDNPELLALLLPQIRADFVAMDGYRYRAGAPLDCELLCVNGSSDHLVGRDAARAWATQTSRHAVCEWLPGGHFFINESRAALVRLIVEAVEDGVLPSDAALPRGD
jgi:surfactin synthase thioesterase subunit